MTKKKRRLSLPAEGDTSLGPRDNASLLERADASPGTRVYASPLQSDDASSAASPGDDDDTSPSADDDKWEKRMAEKCDYCNSGEAIAWITVGIYGIDEPIGVCSNRECVDKAHRYLIDEADSVNLENA